MSQKQQNAVILESGGNIQKVKSGRKKKEQTSRYLETPMNPYYKVYERLMKYLDSIGLIHGLCFTAQLRRSLKQFNKYPDIQWKETSDGWYYTEQLTSLKKDKDLMRRIRRVVFAIKARCRRLKLKNLDNSEPQNDSMARHNNLSKWTYNKIIDFIIRPGQMVDPQCRHEIYTLNISLLQSIFSKRIRGRNISRYHALKFFESSRFFSRKFTSFKKKNWIQIKRCAQEDIANIFIKMFAYFKVNYQDILYNFEEWNQYNNDMKNLFSEEMINQTDEGQAKTI